MTQIPDDPSGSLQAGLDFVVDSVEKCLKPGGIAVHTTEYNLSSNSATFESPNLSIYRRQDLDELVALLRDRGHQVEELKSPRTPPTLISTSTFARFRATFTSSLRSRDTRPPR